VRRATSKKKPEEKDSGGKAKRSWILRLNPKGQATIPLEVRRMLGVGGECRELELRATAAGLLLLPHKPPLPVGRYVGYCAEELKDVDDAVAFVRRLRGRPAETPAE